MAMEALSEFFPLSHSSPEFPPIVRSYDEFSALLMAVDDSLESEDILATFQVKPARPHWHLFGR